MTDACSLCGKEFDLQCTACPDDLEFARRTEEAWKQYEREEFISMSEKGFLKELEPW